MKRLEYIFIFLFIIQVFIVDAQIIYPETLKREVIDTYFDTKISDDYRWLEKLESIEVEEWVKLQNKVSEKYLSKLEKTYNSKLNIGNYMYHSMDYDKDIDLETDSKLYFKLLYTGFNSLASIFYAKGLQGDYEKLISPSSISKKDKIIFTSLKPSKNGRFLAYQYSRNGSDWKEIKIVQIKNRRYFKEVLKHVVTSEIYWYGQGFFYKEYQFDSNHAKRVNPKIKYHQLATEQEKDKLLFEVDTENEDLNVYGTSNQSLFIVKKSNKFTNKFSLYYKDPKEQNFEFKPLFENIKYDINIIGFKSDTVLALTTIKQNKFILSFPLKQPKQWKILSPTYKDAVLTSYEILDDKIVVSYQGSKASFLTVLDYKGKVLGEVVTPVGLSISGLVYSKVTNEFYFKLSSYTVPPVTCQLDLVNFKFNYLGKVKVAFDASNYKFLREEFTSYDGTKVPIFLVFKDSLKTDGSERFLLKTYGGYGTVAKPSYDPGIIYFIEKGGVFAYVNVRGGGEFGIKWWEDGKKMNKKNSILDFTSAAEFLIEKGYTKARKIAITGTSHGGLVTAGALIEKPELFGAAVIDVGVLDMLRFEMSAVGSVYTNVNEFGSNKNKEEFFNKLSYSPYHNVDNTINYPSTLIMTGSDDNRVPPYHSYKFAALLQSNPLQKKPILLWSQDKTGHYGANNINSMIQERAFMYSFLFNELIEK